MGFPRQEYSSELPFPSPEVFSHPGIEPGSPALQADALLSEPPLIYHKRSKNLQDKKDNLFNKWYWGNWIWTFSHTSLFSKLNSEWIKALNVRCETINLLEDNTKTLFDINHSNIFLDLSPKAKETKAKINKWETNLGAFYTAKETTDQKKKKKTMYGIEKLFSNNMINKGLISKINNKLTQLNI